MLDSFIAFNINGISNFIYMITSNLWFLLLLVGVVGTIVLLLKEEVDTLLMVYAWFKNRKESVLILNHIKFSILLKERPKNIEQTAYSFAPFILLAAGLYMLWRLVF